MRAGYSLVCRATGGLFQFGPKDARGMAACAQGTSDRPTALKLSKHIHTADKGMSHDIANAVPQ